MPLVGGGLLSPASLAPVLGPPANLTVEDLSGTPTFAWTYVPAPGTGNTQTAYAFRQSVPGSSAYLFWNAGTTSWQGTTIYNTSSSGSITFPSASWGNGVSYNWTVSTQDANGFGPFASPFTVTGQGTLAVTVSAPSGSIATAQPTVAWSTSFPTGGVAQTAYRVVIYNAAQYGAGGFTPGSGPSVYDSTVVGSATVTSLPLATPPLPGPATPVFLANSTSFRAYVQITATGGQLSPWAYSAFATSFTAPATPTITATAMNDPITGAPMIQLVVTGSAYSGSAPQCIILRDDGVYVRGASPQNPGQLDPVHYMLTINDYEVLQTVTYTYTAYLIVSS